MKEIILATSNLGKIKEFKQLLAPTICIPQADLGISDAEETGLSFIENAILKARHASSLANKPALADDSGLVVPSLNGEPGIYSARYAGIKANDEDNIQLLLRKMADLSQEQRQAYFYCAIALITTGVFHGVISTKPSGTNGFGYDPIFYLNEYRCTAAELPAKIKNRISHRAKALNQLRALLPD
jgi:XTP/dITP diphosphohydrolase